MALANQGRQPVRAQLIASAGQAEGFARVQAPRPFVFPADHGSHDEYKTEWWYYTGNVQAADGRHFGYQLTFFRSGLLPPDRREARASSWAADQVFMAHFALTDVAGKQFKSFERFSRRAAGLADVQADPFRVWLQDWCVEQMEPGVHRLRAAQGGLSLDLTLRDRKGPVLQGDRGLSQKGAEPGNASYYYSLTRLESTGTVRLNEATFQVAGLSWMDHEFSSSYLSGDQIGWDWFAFQLGEAPSDEGGPFSEGGSELMLFQLRRKEGGVDPYASGMFVAPDGTTRRLTRDDFQISPGAAWRSPRSGAAYPAAWTVRVPALDLTLDIKPYLADQEHNLSYRYWEGAVQIRGEQAGRAITGSGYVELTGYAGSMAGQF